MQERAVSLTDDDGRVDLIIQLDLRLVTGAYTHDSILTHPDHEQLQGGTPGRPQSCLLLNT